MHTHTHTLALTAAGLLALQQRHSGSSSRRRRPIRRRETDRAQRRLFPAGTSFTTGAQVSLSLSPPALFPRSVNLVPFASLRQTYSPLSGHVSAGWPTDRDDAATGLETATETCEAKAAADSFAPAADVLSGLGKAAAAAAAVAAEATTAGGNVVAVVVDDQLRKHRCSSWHGSVVTVAVAAAGDAPPGISSDCCSPVSGPCPIR